MGNPTPRPAAGATVSVPLTAWTYCEAETDSAGVNLGKPLCLKPSSSLCLASDYTLYPFSTQNPKDFQNLLSVYLDAAFFPCLRELDFWYVEIGSLIFSSAVESLPPFNRLSLFRQEGWRLEHEDPNDPQTPLVFKGVVFNEMKGAFVSVSLSRAVLNYPTV